MAPVKQVLRREAHSRRLTTVSDGPCLQTAGLWASQYASCYEKSPERPLPNLTLDPGLKRAGGSTGLIAEHPRHGPRHISLMAGA